MSLSRQGYPLGALFVLVTLCAVLLAGVTPLVHMTESGGAETTAFLIATGCGALCGLVVGMVMGLLQFRLGLGVVMGGGVGAIIGIAAGLMSLLSSDQILTAGVAMTAGSALVVGVAYVMRRATS